MVLVCFLRRVAFGDETVERVAVLALALLPLEFSEGLGLVLQRLQRFASLLVKGAVACGAVAPDVRTPARPASFAPLRPQQVRRRSSSVLRTP